MSTCGKCQKSVAASDVTCPHCGVLLAAYASPIGSGAASTYVPPPPPPSTEIPTPDMEVKPPSEMEVVTDPTEVTEEPISTAPRPLFDTYLTVEEIAKAAEGDHAEDVVIVSEEKIQTKTVEFEVPDYARPPADAAPIPTLEEGDDSVPLITRDEDSDAGATAPPGSTQVTEPARPTEDWLYPSPTPKGSPNPKGKAADKPAADSTSVGLANASVAGFDIEAQPVGATHADLPSVHIDEAHVQNQHVTPLPGAADRMAASTQAERFYAAQRAPRRKRHIEDGTETKNVVAAFYGLALFILWFGIIASLLGGHFSSEVFILAVLLTWAFKPVMRFLNEMTEL